MSRKYLDNLDDEGGDVVQDGVYTVEVVDARALEDKPFFWLDLKVLGGPDDGRVIAVGVSVPSDGDKSVFYFRKRIRGFQPLIAKAKVLELADDEQIDAICEAVIGSRVEAVLSVQKGGQYDGRQQLEETRQLVTEDAPPAPTPIRPSAAAKKAADARAALEAAEAEAAAEEAAEPRAAASGETVPIDDDPPF